MKRILFSVIILALLLTACSGHSAEAPRATAALPAVAGSAPESAAPTAEPTPFTAPQTSGSEAAGSLRVNGLSSVLTLEPPADWTWEAVDGMVTDGRGMVLVMVQIGVSETYPLASVTRQ